jgi:hypothetical protein
MGSGSEAARVSPGTVSVISIPTVSGLAAATGLTVHIEARCVDPGLRLLVDIAKMIVRIKSVALATRRAPPVAPTKLD